MGGWQELGVGLDGSPWRSGWATRWARGWLADQPVVVVEAVGREGRRVIASEVAGREWACRAGVRSPRVHHVDPDHAWYVAEWLVTAPATGADYVREAMEVADRIANGPDLPDAGPARSWARAPIPARVVNAARLLRDGFPLSEYRRSRADAMLLPCDVPAHNDFHRENVLATIRGIAVVDWEFAARAPRWSDHVRLATSLTHPEDRATASDLIAERATGEDIVHVSILLRWLSLRLLAENYSAPARRRNPENLASAREAAVQFGEIARRWRATSDGKPVRRTRLRDRRRRMEPHA